MTTTRVANVPGSKLSWAARTFSFPDPVNEVSARVVASGVVVLATVALLSGQTWLTAVLALGFVARVFTGPSLSPLGLLATRVVTPRLPFPPRPVPGPPKRFAQAIGAVLTGTAAILAFAGIGTGADVLLALVIVAATLESGFGLCIGCQLFAVLMRAGLIPAEVCERCANVNLEQSAPVAGIESAPPRRMLVALALVGVGLIAAPVVFRMFDRAPKGAAMIDAFRPYMTDARLAGFQRDIRQIDAGVRQSASDAALIAVGPPAGTAAARFRTRFPDVVSFQRQWPAIDTDMTGMLDAIQRNAGNYRAVAALPRFTLFPWFFVIPGVLLILFVGAGISRPASWHWLRVAVALMGVGLVIAPGVFQMVDRAPKGQRMVRAFRDIETTARVERIQGYFGEIAAGQGAVRLELVPALQRSGLGNVGLAKRFPGIASLDRGWVAILNDLTPMIGAMSDNVANYQAVAALPPFSLFPWFFVLPGLIVTGLALAARPRSASGALARRHRRQLPTEGAA